MTARARQRWLISRGAAAALAVAAAAIAGEPTKPFSASSAPAAQVECAPEYRTARPSANRDRFFQGLSPSRVALLEKLNRADRDHLPSLKRLVVPSCWALHELTHSPLPSYYEPATAYRKALIVHLPAQVFGGYERGLLIRWGPVSSGRRAYPTQPGLYHLNWRSKGRHSSENYEWFMPFYFNYDNRRGLAFHAYPLPGTPASHACIRLLMRDARWLYHWGRQWSLDPDETRPIHRGTPVLVVGNYDYDSPPPWRSRRSTANKLTLPRRKFAQRDRGRSSGE